MDELLRELIEFLKNASPMVWETLHRQVYVQAAQYAFWLVLFGAAVIPCVVLVRKFLELREEDEWGDHELPIALGLMGCALFGILAAFCLVSAVSRLINPDYYAIQIILNSLR